MHSRALVMPSHTIRRLGLEAQMKCRFSPREQLFGERQ